MINVITPPSIERNTIESSKRVFLAGSIELGLAEKWQDALINDLEVSNYLQPLIIYNPRRAQWDSTWEQSVESAPFYQQVIWELNALELSDIIFMYFDPRTRSPISLLELGLYAKSNKLIVCCPEGFWRKGNVDIVCNTYGVPLFDNLSDALEALKIKCS